MAEETQVLDVDDVLLGNRTIFIWGDITKELVEQATKELLALALTGGEPITIFLNSNGGSIMDGLALINAIELIKQKGVQIVVIGIGKVYSMGIFILLTGNYRMMTKDTYFCHHQAQWQFEDDDKAFQDLYRYSRDIKKRMLSMLYKNTKLTKDEVELTKHSELYLTANQCLKKKIIHKVI